MHSYYPKRIRRVAYVLLTILIIFIGFMSAALMSYAAKPTVEEIRVVKLSEPYEPIPSELELVEEQAELQPEVLYLRCTGYTGEEGYTGLTKSGTQVREGVLAGPVKWLGRSCELYDINGNSLGAYTFEDTGNPRYINETRIDRWFPTGKDLKTWQKTVGDYVLLMWR